MRSIRPMKTVLFFSSVFFLLWSIHAMAQETSTTQSTEQPAPETSTQNTEQPAPKSQDTEQEKSSANQAEQPVPTNEGVEEETPPANQGTEQQGADIIQETLENVMRVDVQILTDDSFESLNEQIKALGGFCVVEAKERKESMCFDDTKLSSLTVRADGDWTPQARDYVNMFSPYIRETLNQFESYKLDYVGVTELDEVSKPFGFAAFVTASEGMVDQNYYVFGTIEMAGENDVVVKITSYASGKGLGQQVKEASQSAEVATDDDVPAVSAEAEVQYEVVESLRPAAAIIEKYIEMHLK